MLAAKVIATTNFNIENENFIINYSNKLFIESDSRDVKENCIYVFFELSKYKVIEDLLPQIIADQYLLFHIAENVSGADLLFLLTSIIHLEKNVPNRENSILNILNSNNDYDGLYTWNSKNISIISEIVSCIKNISITSFTVDNIHYVPASHKNKLFKYYLKFNVPENLIEPSLFNLAKEKIISRHYNLAYQFLTTFDSKFNNIQYIEQLLLLNYSTADGSADRYYKFLIEELSNLLSSNTELFFDLAEKYNNLKILIYLSLPCDFQYEISKKNHFYVYFKNGPQKLWIIYPFRKKSKQLLDQYPRLSKLFNFYNIQLKELKLPDVVYKQNINFNLFQDFVKNQINIYRKKNKFPILINDKLRNQIIELQKKFFPDTDIHTQINAGFNEFFIKEEKLYFPIYRNSNFMYVGLCKIYTGSYISFSWSLYNIKYYKIKTKAPQIIKITKKN